MKNKKNVYINIERNKQNKIEKTCASRYNDVRRLWMLDMSCPRMTRA